MVDVFTTAYDAVTGADISEGDTVLVIGDGAVGLLPCHAARLFNPAAIVLAGTTTTASRWANVSGRPHGQYLGDGGLAEVIGGLTDEHGPRRWWTHQYGVDELSTETVQAGGTVSWVGMEVFSARPIWHGTSVLAQPHDPRRVAPVKRYLADLWPSSRTARSDPSPVLTHDLGMEDAATGYTTMATRQEGTVKVAVSPNG